MIPEDQRNIFDRSAFVGATTIAPGRGGIAAVAHLSMRALMAGGYQVSTTSLLDEEAVQLRGIQVRAMRCSRARFALDCHIRTLGASVVLYDSVGLARAHPHPIFKRPYGVWIHGVEVWDHLSWGRARALRRASWVLVNSHHTLSRFQELHFSLPNAKICLLATSHDQPVPLLPRSGEPRVLIVGRMQLDQLYKGHSALFCAWPDVIRSVPNARLDIVGDGNAVDTLKRQVHSAGISDSVQFHGFVSEKRLECLYSRASVFAMPSRGEGFGLVYIEAMRHGVPIIASTHDAGQEVNLDGVTGFNVNLDRQGELASRLIMLLSDRGMAVRMGIAAQARWRDYYCFSAFKGRFLEIIRSERRASRV